LAENEQRPSGEVRGEAAAEALALGTASRGNADRFLDEQTKVAQAQVELLHLQSEDLRREDKLRHWSLRVRHISDVLKLGFELAVAFIVLAVALGLGAAVWQASQADGLVIQSFDVPGPTAEKGLSGQVIANKLLDRLTVMQNATDSTRAASSFTNDWSNDIKVEIPDTGVSLGEVVRFLHGWLGHETHLSGELYETVSGIALTVRMDNAPGQTFTGKPDDLDAVVAQAAEAVFARAQPYRYSVYLTERARFDDSIAVMRKLAASGPRAETAWANVGLAFTAELKGDDAQARAYTAAGQAANPDLPNFFFVLAGIDSRLGHDQAALDDERRGDALLKSKGAREWNPAAIEPTLQSNESSEAQAQGDFAQALAKNVESPGGGGDEPVAASSVFNALSMHDIAAARRYLAALDAMWAGSDPQNFARVDAALLQGLLAMEALDRHGAIAALDEAATARRKIETVTKGSVNAEDFLRTNVLPFKAYALAMLGEFDQADAILKTLPPDCDACARMHGKVEAARHNWGAAAYWFALVSARSPSVPFADADWGRMLLRKGDYDAAIAKLTLANQKGPHFGDPLEMWGEALIRESRSDLALAKFAEADKCAPNWGRLHLKWGEALVYAGQKDEAQKQFAVASSLDLSAADKSELARMRPAHGG
jgi:tetratricopeptide (TPR) repeat protein